MQLLNRLLALWIGGEDGLYHILPLSIFPLQHLLKSLAVVYLSYFDSAPGCFQDAHGVSPMRRPILILGRAAAMAYCVDRPRRRVLRAAPFRRDHTPLARRWQGAREERGGQRHAARLRGWRYKAGCISYPPAELHHQQPHWYKID